MAIFKNHDLLTIELDTGYNISSASEVKILYQKPNATKGEWVGTVTENTKISYAVQADDLDMAGTWVLQSYAVIGGKKGYGAFAYMDVQENID